MCLGNVTKGNVLPGVHFIGWKRGVIVEHVIFEVVFVVEIVGGIVAVASAETFGGVIGGEVVVVCSGEGVFSLGRGHCFLVLV